MNALEMMKTYTATRLPGRRQSPAICFSIQRTPMWASSAALTLRAMSRLSTAPAEQPTW